jgi:hypothetical protein
MTGTANYSFTANSLPTRGRNLGVPGSLSTSPTGDQTTTLWYEQAFPTGTDFAGPGLGTWGWTYTAGSGACTQGNGNGWGNDNGRGKGGGGSGWGFD